MCFLVWLRLFNSSSLPIFFFYYSRVALILHLFTHSPSSSTCYLCLLCFTAMLHCFSSSSASSFFAPSSSFPVHSSYHLLIFVSPLTSLFFLPPNHSPPPPPLSLPSFSLLSLLFLPLSPLFLPPSVPLFATSQIPKALL